MVAAFGDSAEHLRRRPDADDRRSRSLRRACGHVEQGRPRCAAADRRGRVCGARSMRFRSSSAKSSPPAASGGRRPVRRHHGAEAGPAARVRGAGARSCAASPRGLHRGGRRHAGRSQRCVSAAIPPFRALVKNVARLDGISPKALVTQLDLDNFEKGFPDALRAAERIVDYVDRWSH